MLPYDVCDSELDVNEGGAFRCYEDNNFSTYKPTFNGNCDFILGMNETDSQWSVQIVPNPVCSNFKLLGVNYSDILTIKDLQGKEWFFEQNENHIHIENLPKGMYILSVKNDNKSNHVRFVKQ